MESVGEMLRDLMAENDRLKRELAWRQRQESTTVVDALIAEVERLRDELYMRDVDRQTQLAEIAQNADAYRQSMSERFAEEGREARGVSRCGSMSGLGERCCDAYGHNGPHHDSGERQWTHTPHYAE